jgi:hypothetical protein
MKSFSIYRILLIPGLLKGEEKSFFLPLTTIRLKKAIFNVCALVHKSIRTIWGKKLFPVSVFIKSALNFFPTTSYFSYKKTFGLRGGVGGRENFLSRFHN